MGPNDVRIATIDTVEGCREHERLQNLVWGHDPPEAVPTHLLIAAARHGGVVLGAYADAMMVGLLLSLPALHDGQLVHLSHLLGVHPGWRGRGIGAALKWRQRELVLAQGIETIVWTYDPLEAANARLNLAHLGGVACTYTRDYYGAMDDALNRGIPSDRFVLTWRLKARRVRERAAAASHTPHSPSHGLTGPSVAATTDGPAEGPAASPSRGEGDNAPHPPAHGLTGPSVAAATDGPAASPSGGEGEHYVSPLPRTGVGGEGPPADAPLALGSEVGPQGLRRPAAFVPPTGTAVLVEIPAQVQQIKRRALEVALAWRLATREAFEHLFTAGYVATDVIRHGERVFYYVEQSGADAP